MYTPPQRQNNALHIHRRVCQTAAVSIVKAAAAPQPIIIIVAPLSLGQLLLPLLRLPLARLPLLLRLVLRLLVLLPMPLWLVLRLRFRRVAGDWTFCHAAHERHEFGQRWIFACEQGCTPA
jgi:hypothetical protein